MLIMICTFEKSPTRHANNVTPPIIWFDNIVPFLFAAVLCDGILGANLFDTEKVTEVFITQLDCEITVGYII